MCVGGGGNKQPVDRHQTSSARHVWQLMSFFLLWACCRWAELSCAEAAEGDSANGGRAHHLCFGAPRWSKHTYGTPSRLGRRSRICPPAHNTENQKWHPGKEGGGWLGGLKKARPTWAPTVFSSAFCMTCHPPYTKSAGRDPSFNTSPQGWRPGSALRTSRTCEIGAFRR